VSQSLHDIWRVKYLKIIFLKEEMISPYFLGFKKIDLKNEIVIELIS